MSSGKQSKPVDAKTGNGKWVMPLRPAERMKIPRQEPVEQDAQARACNFDEVSEGFNAERAGQEALRCLECRDPVCMHACPVNIDIREFIRLIYQQDYRKAAETIRMANYLPGICGRVCPQEMLCEKVCPVGRKNEPVAIGKLERFVADYEMNNDQFTPPSIAPSTGRRVAIVGSGPGGLTAAAGLAQKGHEVTIFEALHESGGVLKFGIPEFRLPKRIVNEEVDRVRSLGVHIETNVIIGRTLTIDELFDEHGYEAVYLGTGAGSPKFLNIPGENLSGVYSASELLTRVNLMKAYRFPEFDTPVKIGQRVAVIGGGDTAMDAARTALRLGPDETLLFYRRAREQMPARVEEVHHAEEEGVAFHLLTNPVCMHGDENGWVRSIECQKMQLGEADEQGRRRPVPVEGEKVIREVDSVVVAIGQRPNPIIQHTTPGLETTDWGTVVVDEQGATSREGVFAGGDISRGGATVIEAVADGKKAAQAVDRYLQKRYEEIDENGRPV